jgi:hypothetical protein
LNHFGYCRVGQLLHKYTSGPLPKPFKIVPSLPAWARILALTRPEEWSPQACHAATRILVSQMKPAQARVYLEGVVLDAIREDIRSATGGKGNRPLHPHYYETLRRAVYKPGAFFKGIVFPLLEVSPIFTCEDRALTYSFPGYSQGALSKRRQSLHLFLRRRRFQCCIHPLL